MHDNGIGPSHAAPNPGHVKLARAASALVKFVMFGGTDQSMVKLRMSHLLFSFIGTRLNCPSSRARPGGSQPGSCDVWLSELTPGAGRQKRQNMHTGARQRG